MLVLFQLPSKEEVAYKRLSVVRQVADGGVGVARRNTCFKESLFKLLGRKTLSSVRRKAIGLKRRKLRRSSRLRKGLTVQSQSDGRAFPYR